MVVDYEHFHFSFFSKSINNWNCNIFPYSSKDNNATLPCEDGAIRLVGGGTPYQGRVEMCYRGYWGTVCQTFWDRTDARTVCRLLGYGANSDLVLPTTANFFSSVPPEGPVFVRRIDCSGNETDFLSCLSADPGGHTCGHGRDVGVFCPGKFILCR